MVVRVTVDGMRDLAFLFVACVAAVAIASGVAGSAAAQSGDANVTVYWAADETFENATDIERAIENGTLDAGRAGFHGEPIVVEIDSERLARDMDERDGTTTERFFAVENATFVFAERDFGTMVSPVRVVPGVENTTVYRNGTTVYAVVDTAAAEHRNLGHAETVDDSRVQHGVTMAAVFGYDLNLSRLAQPPEHAPGFEYYADRAWLTAPDLSLPLIPDVNELAVRTFAEPADELELRVTLEDGTIISETAATAEDRPISLDLSDVEPGTEYTLELRFDGHLVEQHDGTVTAPEASVTDVQVVDTTPDAVILNVTAEATHRSTVEVRTDLNVRLDHAWLDPGEGTVSLAVPREEVDESLEVRVATDSYSPMQSYENEEAERPLDLTDVVDESDGDDGTGDGQTGEPPTPTPGPEHSDEDRTDSDGAENGDDDERAGDDDGFGDGLTIVAALVALALVVAIAHRRQRR